MYQDPKLLEKKFGSNWPAIVCQDDEDFVNNNEIIINNQIDKNCDDKAFFISSQRFSEKGNTLIQNQPIENKERLIKDLAVGKIKNLFDKRQVKLDNLLNKAKTKYAEYLEEYGNIVSLKYCIEMVYRSGEFNINTTAEDKTLEALNMPQWVFDSFCNRVLLLSIDDIGQDRNPEVGTKEGARILYEIWCVGKHKK